MNQVCMSSSWYINSVFDSIFVVVVTGLHKQITNRELTLLRSLCRTKHDDKNKRERDTHKCKRQNINKSSPLSFRMHSMSVLVRKRLNQDHFLCLHLRVCVWVRALRKFSFD